MQKLILVLAILCSAIAGNTQDSFPPIQVKAGVGIGDLKLGMSDKQSMAILKGSIQWWGFEKTMLSYSEYGRVDSCVQFVIGFDSCGQYMQDLPETMPVFGVYFKDHRLNYIKISSFGAEQDHLDRLVLNGNIKFGQSMKDCGKQLGTDYLSVKFGEYSGIHYYYKLGLEMVYDENKLVAIGIYRPLPRFKTLIAEKSEKLKAQLGADKDRE